MLDVGILVTEPEATLLPSSLHLSQVSLKIVIEGNLMDNIPDLQKAMCTLFGLA